MDRKTKDNSTSDNSEKFETLQDYIETQIKANGHKLFFDRMMNSWFFIPMIGLPLFFVLHFIDNIVTLKGNNKPINYSDIGLLVFVSLLSLGVAVFFLLIISKDVISVFQDRIEIRLRNKCKECINVKENVKLNAYNLYTYKQILQTEQSLPGNESAVYCYSRYRDDGNDVGQKEAERIVEYNLKRGIQYYYIYYEEPVLDNPGGADSLPEERLGEHFINLSKVYPEKYKKFLDYRIYSNSVFDIMIYKYSKTQKSSIDGKSSTKDYVVGYMGLNFPIQGREINCDSNCGTKDCPLNIYEHGTSRYIYKKMPETITTDLYRRLNSVIEYNKKSTS